jgi:hypothetical protein
MTGRPNIHVKITRYPYPQTIASMIPVRWREIAAHAHEIPACPHGHGPMKPREPNGQSYESLYCGIWYDCKNGCSSSTTWPSRECAYDHGVPYNTGTGWEKFDGTKWVPASRAEVDAFWAEHAAWETSRQPKPLTATRRKARAGR